MNHSWANLAKTIWYDRAIHASASNTRPGYFVYKYKPISRERAFNLYMTFRTLRRGKVANGHAGGTTGREKCVRPDGAWEGGGRLLAEDPFRPRTRRRPYEVVFRCQTRLSRTYDKISIRRIVLALSRLLSLVPLVPVAVVVTGRANRNEIRWHAKRQHRIYVLCVRDGRTTVVGREPVKTAAQDDLDVRGARNGLPRHGARGKPAGGVVCSFFSRTTARFTRAPRTRPGHFGYNINPFLASALLICIRGFGLFAAERSRTATRAERRGVRNVFVRTGPGGWRGDFWQRIRLPCGHGVGRRACRRTKCRCPYEVVFRCQTRLSRTYNNILRSLDCFLSLSSPVARIETIRWHAKRQHRIYVLCVRDGRTTVVGREPVKTAAQDDLDVRGARNGLPRHGARGKPAGGVVCSFFSRTTARFTRAPRTRPGHFGYNINPFLASALLICIRGFGLFAAERSRTATRAERRGVRNVFVRTGPGGWRGDFWQRIRLPCGHGVGRRACRRTKCRCPYEVVFRCQTRLSRTYNNILRSLDCFLSLSSPVARIETIRWHAKRQHRIYVLCVRDGRTTVVGREPVKTAAQDDFDTMAPKKRFIALYLTGSAENPPVGSSVLFSPERQKQKQNE